ncbi:delta(8)-fatty-acid desaturase 2-like [Senna tora]|uniref:Delta(8)-fatty-acid desaturase 2-like n=1 Tax=Senna tora TaxID=362788 RepID=A0A834WPD4_9FABA|nr:delta(8)-fatty-acid desaturase 2-like [Senna tora]
MNDYRRIDDAGNTTPVGCANPSGEENLLEPSILGKKINMMCFARINLFVQTIHLVISNRKVENRGMNIVDIVSSLFSIINPFGHKMHSTQVTRSDDVSIFVMVGFSETLI